MRTLQSKYNFPADLQSLSTLWILCFAALTKISRKVLLSSKPAHHTLFWVDEKYAGHLFTFEEKVRAGYTTVMNGKIYYQFISSFFMGALTGGFLYVTVFAPEYKKDLGSTDGAVQEGIVIEGQMYGACDDVDSCASFRLFENRSFKYIPYPDVEVENGKLPVEVNDALFSAIKTGSLKGLDAETNSGSCASDTEGLDFVYAITDDDAVQTFDTCTTALAGDVDAQVLFINAWNFMQNPTTTYPAILEKGIGEYFIDRFQQAGEVE